MRKIERSARKWAIRELEKFGEKFPTNASYIDVSVSAMKNAKQLIGKTAVFDGGYEPGPLLVALRIEHERIEHTKKCFDEFSRDSH